MYVTTDRYWALLYVCVRSQCHYQGMGDVPLAEH